MGGRSKGVQMSISLDHVFICCDPGGPEAEALAALGLPEGAGNVHPGQGTANRRFFFQGGFIELLWVHDPAEVQGALTAPTRLWQRWSARHAGICRFGVAFSPSGDEVHEPPFEAWPYRPAYLPADKTIWFARDTVLDEPALFYLAWPNPQVTSANHQRGHQTLLTRLLSASVGVPADAALSPASLGLRSAGLLGFHASGVHELVLNFEAPRDVCFDLRPTLGLLLQGSTRRG